jgi:hypothetical protein
LKSGWYKSVKIVAKRVSDVLHLIHQVSHKGSPKNGGRGQKFLTEFEAKSYRSQDLRHRRVGVQDHMEQSDDIRTTKSAECSFQCCSKKVEDQMVRKSRKIFEGNRFSQERARKSDPQGLESTGF